MSDLSKFLELADRLDLKGYQRPVHTDEGEFSHYATTRDDDCQEASLAIRFLIEMVRTAEFNLEACRAGSETLQILLDAQSGQEADESSPASLEQETDKGRHGADMGNSEGV